MLSIVIFDAWNLLSSEAVTQRWTLAVVLLIVNTIIWYLCKVKFKNQVVYKILLVTLIVFDIIFAAINVYLQRGMASKSVMLFVMPLLSAAIVRSRSLLLATASFSAAAYSLATVRYFYDNYGQGLRVELYGEIFFYSVLFFVVAGMLQISFRSAPD
jgi:predicted neutral ceramidase superfamily lipid hydrolase